MRRQTKAQRNTRLLVMLIACYIAMAGIAYLAVNGITASIEMLPIIWDKNAH